MLKNHFLVAFRTLLSNRMYSIINVFGLTVGISSCLVIFLIVRFEWSFNRSIPERERIYRVYTAFSGDFEGTNRGVCTGVQEAVTTQFTGLSASFPLHGWSTKVSLPGEKATSEERESRLAITTPAYFNVISTYSWIRGSASALMKPGNVVLTVEQARKYMGNGSPDAWMGQTLYYDSVALTVAGLVEPEHSNMDFQFTDFISLATIESTQLKDQITLNDWQSTNSSAQVFLRLADGASVGDIEAQLPALDEEYRKHNTDNGWVVSFKLQPLDDLHFNTNLGIFDFSRPAAHLGILGTLSLVALVLVVLASINFINLETARAVRRSREVGIRKVLGSSRGQLIWHFLAQSLVTTLIAILVAIPAAEMGLLMFQDFIPAGVTLSLTDLATLAFLGLVLFAVGALSGLYPAFVLSSFLPATALKSQGYSHLGPSRSSVLRRGLIVFQFASAQLLIMGTLVILSQMDYMLNKDLGFEHDAVIHINPPWKASEEKRFTLKNEVERIPRVAQVTLCQQAPAAKGYSSNVLAIKRGGEEIKKSVMRKFGDSNYLSVYGIKLVAGRNLTPNHKTEILVNEAFLKEFGLTPDEAMGTEARQNNQAYTIVGVMKDYHVFSLHGPYQPVYMSGWEEDLYGISLKLTKADAQHPNYQPVLADLEAAWKKVYPEYRFKYEFVDETIRGFYETERRMSKLAGTAMVIAIIISCLGLFALASYTAVQRSKEVGIRKVMGATVENILVLLSADFVKLVALAFVIAVPVAWWGADKFLSNYSFHITPGWSMYAIAGASSMLLAFLTVSYQALKTSYMNPVESLRTE